MELDLVSWPSLLRRVIVVVGISLLAACGGGDTQPGATQAPTAAASPETPAAVAAIDSEKLYNRYCFSCHAAGIANAPKFGDPESWGPRLAKGREALLLSVVEGMPPGMPAKGLCNACSDEELAAVTDFMLAAVSESSE